MGMFKRVLQIVIVSGIMGTLFFLLPSCSKKTPNETIQGTWYLTDDPSCMWTFTYGKNPSVKINKICGTNKVYRNIRDCDYSINNNTLSLYNNSYYNSYRGQGGHVINGNLIVDYRSHKRLLLSGTIQIDSVKQTSEIIYSDEIYIIYE